MILDPVILNNIELFSGLDMTALSDVVRSGKSLWRQRGAVIFREGQVAEACHVLIAGRVRISRSGDERGRVVIRFVGPGEMFGALGVFHGGRYPADALAVEDCVELQWSAAAMTTLMKRYPQIALNALDIVGRRLGELQERLGEAMAERVEQRIARALTRLTRQAGSPVEAGTEIGFPLSRKDLAALTGTRHFTVSRILSDWEERGIVASHRKRIVVLDSARLEAIATASAAQEP